MPCLMRILVIEDNADILANITNHLQRQGYIVDCAQDGLRGYTMACEGQFDLIILDLMLPRLDGYQLCQKLREEAKCYIPVIMVTARDTLDNRLQGFDVGADDYLVKPFSLAELSARVRALINRTYRIRSNQVLQVGDLVFHQETLVLKRGQDVLKLPPTPLRILTELMQASPGVVHRSKLEEILWTDSPPDSDSLRTHIHQIRQIIDKPYALPLLQTVHGIGYKLIAP